MAAPGPAPLATHPNGKLFKYFLPQDPEFPIQRAVLNAWLPYFLGADAAIDSFNDDSVGFYYWAWRSFTTAMIEDLQGKHGNTRAITAHAPHRNPVSQQYPPAVPHTTHHPQTYPTATPAYPPAPLNVAPPPLPPAEFSIHDYTYDQAGKPYWHNKEGRYLTPTEIQLLVAAGIVRAPPPPNPPPATDYSSQYDHRSAPPGEPSLSVMSHPYDPQSVPRAMSNSNYSSSENPVATVAAAPPPSTASTGYWTYDSTGRRMYVRDGQIVQYAD